MDENVQAQVAVRNGALKKKSDLFSTWVSRTQGKKVGGKTDLLTSEGKVQGGDLGQKRGAMSDYKERRGSQDGWVQR